MTFMGLLVENLHDIHSIEDIAKKIMIKHVVPFMESKMARAHYNINEFFDSKKEVYIHLQSVDGVKSAEVISKVGKIIILFNVSKGYNYPLKEYYSTLKHEVIHVLDTIQSKGKHSKSYLDIESKFFQEREFNEKIHEIAIYIRSRMKKENVLYKNREQVLELVKKATSLPHSYFYEALIKYPELYTKVLKRLVREKLLIKE